MVTWYIVLCLQEDLYMLTAKNLNNVISTIYDEVSLQNTLILVPQSNGQYFVSYVCNKICVNMYV